ncbi:hypothetical protein E6O75_ATG06636 [Venturia nashicola]|uniref:Uncharacterized protein n=1 Tax=Venturia nashicola TaxID=86259 RepID=A0A4Z1P395_9PEZI|nr:hypothetical protein E6O75_ATG06636 [Venturia nashicola]
MLAQLSYFTSILAASATVSSSHASSTNISTITSVAYHPSITLTPSGFSSVSEISSYSQISNLTHAKPQTTVSLFNACSGSDRVCAPIESITYYGAVLSADATKTAYLLDCAAYAGNVTECFDTPMTVTQGVSLFQRSDKSGATPVTISCNIFDKTKSAVCEQKMLKTKSAVIASASFTGFPKNSLNGTGTTSTVTFGKVQIHYNNLVITSGVEKLVSATATATNTPKTPTSAGTGFSPTQTGAAMTSASAPSSMIAGVVAILFAVFVY